MPHKIADISPKMKRQDAVYALVDDDTNKVKYYALTSAAYSLFSQTNTEVAKGKAFAKAARISENLIRYTVDHRDIEEIERRTQKAKRNHFHLDRKGRDSLVIISKKDLGVARSTANLNKKGNLRSTYKPIQIFINDKAQELVSVFDI